MNGTSKSPGRSSGCPVAGTRAGTRGQVMLGAPDQKPRRQGGPGGLGAG